jgi:hypothetical protein
VTRRGLDQAKTDPTLAGVVGSIFGGPTLRPLAVVEQIWEKALRYVATEGPRAMSDLLGGRGFAPRGVLSDLAVLERGLRTSLTDDPRWHLAWTGDVLKAAAATQATIWTVGNPRIIGPLA